MTEFYEIDEPVDYVVAAFDRGTVGQTVNLDLGQSYRDTAAENETLRQELADANQRIANLSAQCHRNTEQLGRLQREAAERDAERDRYRQHSIALNSVGYRIAEAMADHKDADQYVGDPLQQTDWLIADRDAMREVVEAAKAVRELWRYDAMAAAEPEIHAFVAAVDALAAKDGA